MLEIETINRCNNDCPFCPVNVRDDPRKKQLMSEALLEKIALELEKVQFSGFLALYSNNEPLIDQRLSDISAYFRSKLPKAHIYIYTNGKMINYAILTRLIAAGLDQVVIDNYDDSLNLIAPVRKLLEEIEKEQNQALNLDLTVIMRLKNELLANRAGNAPNKTAENIQDYLGYANSGCYLPFTQMVIRPSGQVSKCCNDALGQVTLGDVHSATIEEIWNNPIYTDIRHNLLTRGRKSETLCRTCDVSSVTGMLFKKILAGHQFYNSSNLGRHT
ncbi:MAG: radical SAM/SPASM domain-containing protein [Magnetococcales bacterium]|nr:radical SAM/SPASM domain-containing protein [Magnetococcales bacterium]MBF0149690.1 radical SAM/SPASM domain-containing protein [Magnetococcales bacterium]MBF0630740.1 radical SAM/SPASM domain-containing protein [Magnetococcales bacterium]